MFDSLRRPCWPCCFRTLTLVLLFCRAVAAIDHPFADSIATVDPGCVDYDIDTYFTDAINQAQNAIDVLADLRDATDFTTTLQRWRQTFYLKYMFGTPAAPPGGYSDDNKAYIDRIRSMELPLDP